jgi:hypothetical protein
MSTAAVEIPPPPTEGEAPPAETETPPVEGETPVEAPAEGETTEAPAEGEQPAAAAPEKPEIPEADIKAAALKYANATMAAARRAESRIESVKQENAQLSTTLKAHTDFVERLQKGDSSALALIGVSSVRELLDRFANHGEAKPKTPEDIAREEVERRWKEREEQIAAREHAATVASEQARVFALVDADKTNFARTATRRGHEELWGALGEYHNLHAAYFANNPWTNEMVLAVANAVEKDLRQEFGDPPQVSATRPAAKNGASPSGTATPGRNSGKTLTHKGSGGAPTERTRTYASEEELNAQIAEELRAEQLI